MKKVTTWLLAFLIIISFSGNALAQSTYLQGYSPKIVGVLDSVRYSAKGDTEEIVIDISKYSDYSILRLKSPERVAIDILGVDAPGRQQIIDVNSKLIKTIRYAQFDKGIARVVLDVVEQPDIKVKSENGRLIILANTPKVKGENNSRDEERDTADRSGDNRDEAYSKGELSIKHFISGGDEKVTITMGSKKDFNVMRLTGPDRIVVDIPNSAIDISQRQKEIAVSSNLIKAIRYAQFSSDVVRVVLDVEGQLQYEVNNDQEILTLSLKNPAYKNIKYHNHSDRVYLTLNGVKLTQNGEVLKKLYSSQYDSDGKKYIMTFPSKLADLGTGTININDGYLDSIEITEDTVSGNTSIIFNAKGKYEYVAFTRAEINDTAITIVKPAINSEKLVVIDAGHGGSEPGAIYGSLYEKSINLDIAIKLNNLLTKNNIKTYMMRQEDIYVDYYERAHIANALNASLFLSIHNNAMTDRNFDGTMTLYFPQRSSSSGINGKAFAEIIQSRLLENLKTTDRKIRERPDLVVLKYTKMPAALAEVAFLTNAKDRSSLQSEEFRNKAAQALCDGIMEALSNMK